jgi:hypothetical protein
MPIFCAAIVFSGTYITARFGNGVVMPIWKLTPIDLEDEEWDRSIYKGDVIVWAKDENEAREVANCRFDKSARHLTRTLCSP